MAKKRLNAAAEEPEETIEPVDRPADLDGAEEGAEEGAGAEPETPASEPTVTDQEAAAVIEEAPAQAAPVLAPIPWDPHSAADCLAAVGIKSEHIESFRAEPEGELTIVTKGGRKLHFPGDEAKAAALTDSERDGISRTGFPPANVLAPRAGKGKA